MDIATLIGLIGAMGVVGGAIALGGDFGAFIDIPSIVVVVGGTSMAVMASHTLGQFLGSFKVGLVAILYKPRNTVELIEEAVELANVARKEGVLALEGREISHPFLEEGIGLCIDGHPPEVVQKLMAKDINLSIQRHELGAGLFKIAGDTAPAMGMIGTLVGLVQMLGNMEDPKSIGPAMAVALLTTLYGAVIANAFAIPISNKLALRSNEERQNKDLILESISGIQEGVNPRVLEQILLTFVPQGKRQKEGGDE